MTRSSLFLFGLLFFAANAKTRHNVKGSHFNIVYKYFKILQCSNNRFIIRKKIADCNEQSRYFNNVTINPTQNTAEKVNKQRMKDSFRSKQTKNLLNSQTQKGQQLVYLRLKITSIRSCQLSKQISFMRKLFEQ